MSPFTDIPNYTEDRAHNTDTLHTPFSPQGWDVFDVNSSAQASFYKPVADPLSPSADGAVDFYTKYPSLDHENKIPFSEQFLDISSLPVVIEDLASRGAAGMASWEVPAPTGWHAHDTEHNKNNTNIHNTMPFIEEDSLDMKMVSVIPREVESNNVVISEYILNDHRDLVDGAGPGRARGLSVDVAARAPAWRDDDIISTPEVLNYVEQLETEKCTLPSPVSRKLTLTQLVPSFSLPSQISNDRRPTGIPRGISMSEMITLLKIKFDVKVIKSLRADVTCCFRRR